MVPTGYRRAQIFGHFAIPQGAIALFAIALFAIRQGAVQCLAGSKHGLTWCKLALRFRSHRLPSHQVEQACHLNIHRRAFSQSH